MLRFFDCDVAVGSSGLGWRVPCEASELLPVMDRYGIERALVYDRGAAEAGVFDNFDGILRFCAGSDRLVPTIAVTPPATGESPPPDELIEIIRKCRIGGVRVWPKLHNFNFNAKVFGRLFEVLERHRVPVFYQSMAMSDYPWSHQSDWEGIRDVALAFPNLPIIVIFTGMQEGRKLFPVLESCPNVLTDTTIASYQYIESVVDRYGMRRLVLASHYPQMDPGLQTCWMTCGGVQREAKEAMAFNTVAQLVEGIR